MRGRKKVFCLFLILSIIFVVCIVRDSNDRKLRKMYDKNVVKAINKLNIQDEVISRNKYSKILEVALLNNQFDINNIDLYYEFEYRKDDRFIENLNDLAKLGYDKMEISEIFDCLSYDDINILINHGYVDNISDYLKYSYFDVGNLDRYINYQKVTSYDLEKCIVYVNIGLDKTFYVGSSVVSEPSSILVLVNKYNSLPSDYVPNDLVVINSNYSLSNVKLRKIAASSFEELSADASSLGFSILGMSGYRSYDYQDNLYNRYKESDPLGVDTYSARPGHSEHQTGLALDVATRTTTYTDFGTTKEYTWLKDNAHKYGFIIRYTQDSVNVTGYKCEEWHIRYVGVDVATYIYENNITFDEYHVKFLEK